jgi:hypothetical protein
MAAVANQNGPLDLAKQIFDWSFLPTWLSALLNVARII